MPLAQVWWSLGISIGLCACAAPSGGDVAHSCRADGDCNAGYCLADLAQPPADLDPLPLRCGSLKSGAGLGAACDQAADCDRQLCLLAGACARPCTQSGDCGPDQRCQRVYARAGAESLATASACVDIVNLPETTSRQTQLVPAAVSGMLDELTLPAFAPRVLYVLEHLDDQSWPIPSSLSRCRAPLCATALYTADSDGKEDRELFALDRLALQPDGPDNPIAQGNHVNPLTVWVPNGPRVSAEPRAYRVEVESTQPGAVRITALARETHGLQLDLNLYYVGAADLSPEGTRGPPVLQAALEEVDRIFAQADIFIGEVRQVHVPGLLPARGSDAGQGQVSAGFARLIRQYQVLPELPELLRLSAGAANSALDVFFVADIDSITGAELGGIAAGTPVAFGMHGTPGSGIAIASDMFVTQGRSAALGRTLAHELGHALGLFHTTEVDGLVFDPLPDTKACPLDRDADRDGALNASECAGFAGDNLMFPTSDAGDLLTPEQCEVLRSALLLR